MDYKEILDGQLESIDMSGLEDMMKSASEESGVFPSMTADEMVSSLLQGRPVLDADSILENLLNLFLAEINSAVFLGCEILAVCVVTGLLTNFSGAFGRRTVSSLGAVICGCIITALCIGSFFRTYSYCQDSMDTMTSVMEILLPVMIPLLIAMGGISSGGMMNPVIISAVTGFNFIMQHVVLPMVFLSAVFVLINSITERDYIKKLALLLRRAALFITGLSVTVFSGITAIQGVVTKSADNILVNSAKFSLDNFVPIVGGFAADSLDMVISCAGLIKNAAGLMGIITILSLLAIPVLKILSVALIYKLTAVAAEPVSSKNISDSLSEIGAAAVTMTVVLAMGALMFLIFITVIMGMGGGGLWTS